MAHALPPKTTKMAAVLHCDIATIQTVCEAVSHDGQICTIANDNCPGQLILIAKKADSGIILNIRLRKMKMMEENYDHH